METQASGWQASPLGPWERYRRELDGGRRGIVARGRDGWGGGLWAMLERPVWLCMGEGGTVQEVMGDADRAVAESAVLPDEELARRNGLDHTYAEVETLKVVTVGEGHGCVMCREEIEPGLAAEEAGHAGWLWCGSCAS